MNGQSYVPGKGGWKTNLQGMKKLEWANRLIGIGKTLRFIRYFDDFPFQNSNDIWDDTRQSGFGDEKIYVVQTGTRAVERCVLMTTDPGDLVLDPTCGSGTTAYVAEHWGRRWITIDTSRVALALARTRLMAARFPYYLLADSPEGVRKEQELTGVTPPDYRTGGDIRRGFVYERVPHIMLKSITTNPDIREGMSREEIDKAIARHADQETLYDRPYEDRKKVRVTGPFTVESLSPHRVLPADDIDLDGRVTETEIVAHEEYESRILANLKKAGVQNTVKGERLTFDRLDPFANPWLHATGEYTDAEGNQKRVAVSIGPEFGTVSATQVKEAAKEAVKGVGFDILVVCGFAFDAQVPEEAKRYGKLTILPARLNRELIMKGDGELKKTGAGNLFMVFGEPDIAVACADGEVTVEIRGVDVYDPSTDQIRSDGIEGLACWFIDTNYNGEAFFVRHAYFTGANEPYDKLKRALRAEIDEGAWASLYSTVSRPFPVPETGQIAVKAINHYGDEVMKVINL
jgi:adenine-specific DNA-methyltransferase